MFSLIRGRGGHNDNPTTVQAKAALRGIVCNNMIKQTSKGQNCESTDLCFLLPSIPSEPDPENTESSDAENKELLDIMTKITLDDDRFDVDLDADVDEATSYVTGHGIQRVILCDDCKKNLRKSSSCNSFMSHKTYDETCQLYCPRDEVVSDVISLKKNHF